MTSFLLAALIGSLASAETPGASEAPAESSAAQLESLRLAVVESFPLRVEATLGGWLLDACSRLEAVSQRFEPDSRTYHLEATLLRSGESGCAQSVTPLEITVPLVKAGMASGEFIVRAHGLSASFEIEPLGDFPGLDLPSVEPALWICSPEPRLCFAAPREWTGAGLTWASPTFLSAELGLRWWPGTEEDPERLLPAGSEVHDRTIGRLGGALGTRMTASRQEGGRWSEHLFARCGEELWCEFWLEAPSEPLLDAAGEPFWNLVRFAARY